MKTNGSFFTVLRIKKTVPEQPYSLAKAVEYLGRLGGYKRAPSDGPPGLQSVWRGLFLLWFLVDSVGFIMGQG